MHHTTYHSTNVAKDATEICSWGASLMLHPLLKQCLCQIKTAHALKKSGKSRHACSRMFTVCVWHVSTGAKGNLTERSDYILANVLVTVISVLLVIYFLTYQTYVMRADVITSSILIGAYGVDGLVALSMLTRLVRLVLHSIRWKWFIYVYYEEFLVFFYYNLSMSRDILKMPLKRSNSLKVICFLYCYWTVIIKVRLL